MSRERQMQERASSIRRTPSQLVHDAFVPGDKGIKNQASALAILGGSGALALTGGIIGVVHGVPELGSAIGAVGAPLGVGAVASLGGAGVIGGAARLIERKDRRNFDGASGDRQDTRTFFRFIGGTSVVAALATGAVGLGIGLAVGHPTGAEHGLLDAAQAAGISGAVALGTGQLWHRRIQRLDNPGTGRSLG